MTETLLIAADLKQFDFEASLHESEALIEACGLRFSGYLSQKLEAEQPAYFKLGKCLELERMIEDEGIELVVVNDDLSPIQYRNLKRFVICELWDRSQLILHIFEQRAQTQKAKLEVQLAALQYQLPFVRLNASLGLRQQGGAFRTRGKGERLNQLSLNRTQDMIRSLKYKLKQLENHEETQKRKRLKQATFQIVLFGYTNAGKSSLMNSLIQKLQGIKEVESGNRLFESLNTSVRLMKLKAVPVLVTDTVGVISRLPHHLVESFKSSLAALKDADLVLHVIDGSDTDEAIKRKLGEDLIKEYTDAAVMEIYTKGDIRPHDGFNINTQDDEDIRRLIERLYDFLRQHQKIHEVIREVYDEVFIENLRKEVRWLHVQEQNNQWVIRYRY